MGLKCKYLLKLYMDIVEITDFDSLSISLERTVAYVINLDKRVDRWLAIQKRFKDTSIILERVSAVEDTANGHNGCGQSFLKIIAAAKAQGLENVLIFEDDNIPLDNFDKRWATTKEWLDTHTDMWEIFNGGAVFTADRNPSNCKASVLYTNTDKNIVLYNKINLMSQTNFMYIHKKAFDKILTWTWDKNNVIDCYMNNETNFKTVCIYPMLGIQDIGYSDTINCVRDLNIDYIFTNKILLDIYNKAKTVAYVINLDKRPERWQAIQERFKDSSIILERVSAVEDTANGHNGCGQSFLKIIAAAKAQGLENVLIFEDDNIPLDNFDKRWATTKEWLDSHSDMWQIFNGGGQVPHDLSRYPSWKLSATPLFTDTSLNITVCKTNYLIRANFMYISKRAYDKILTWTWNAHKHIDCFMNDAANFNTVSIYPMLCTQEDAKFSNTTNSVRDLKTLDEYSNNAFMEALGEKKLNIIASMTTIPSRINQMKTVVECILNQTVPFSHLEINIPEKCIRTGETYVIPEWLIAMPRVKIFRTPDYGAITKVAPTFLRYKDDPQTYIWSCDDDVKYPPNTLALYTDGFTPFINEARGYEHLNIDTDFINLTVKYNSAPILQGFGSILYSPQIIKDDFNEYLEFIVNSSECKNDDILLGNYLAKHNISRIVCKPYDICFYDNSILEKYCHNNDALKETYNYKIYNQDCYKYLLSKNMFYFAKVDDNRMKIIASMTTIPSRIAHIKPVLECILNQTVSVKHIEINIPEKCIRTGETYLIPEWLTTMPRVKIFRTPDYGPITKVAPTFLRAAGDNTLYIWSCDDDRLYPPNTLRSLTNGIDHFSNEARGAAPGITVCEDGFAQLENYDSTPSYLQGYGTVLYAPNLIKDDFILYLKYVNTHKDCRAHDDPILSNYLLKHNVLLKVMNPYKLNFCSKEIIADHEYVSDALCRYDGNHTAKTVRVLEFLQQEDLLYLQLKSKKLRLHILGIPHTATNSQYSHCAFTGKVQRFAPMMRPLDYEVYHYGNAGSESGATKDICILSASELELLEIQSLKYLHPSFSDTDIKNIINDKRRIVGDLARWDTPLYKEFNRRLKIELKKYYRSTATDIVCNPYGRSYVEALNDLDIVKVECGIGYKDPCEAWRIYESYAWFHSSMALEGHNGTFKNYWYVIPQSFNVLEWPLNLNPTPKKVGFLGRIGPGKGCHLIVDIARRFPDVEFILCGGGDPIPYLQLPNIKFKPQIHGTERATYLGSLVALIAPTQYVEPYGCISPEAQLCGTPVIAPDSGGFTETVIHMKTGLLCHTLADYCFGVQLALDGQFDRSYIRARAVERYDMTVVAHKWDQSFKSILDMSNGAGGWYGEKSHINNSLIVYEKKSYKKSPLIFYDEHNNKVNNNIFEVTEQVQANTYIKSDSIVLELGARYGTVSCAINRRLENPYNQVSVEPDMRVWDSLEKNKKINGCYFNIFKGFISKKKMLLSSNKDDYFGYGTTSIDDINNSSTLIHKTLCELETMYKLKFNTLVADCEGFLEQFLDENPILYTQLSLIMFEKDCPEKCCYDKIIENLKKHGFNNIVSGFHEVWEKPILFNNFEKKIYSQNGEDGITMKLLELVYNDPYNKYYVEFGAENGKECNTRILLENYGWKGLLMDGTYWNHLINLQKEFITKENIVELFKKYSVPKKINLLSVDIDYNDFYVLHSILKEYVCDIIICEYNSTHLAHEDKIIIYSATSGWDGTNYFGASLYSLQKLGELYNYSLVCCDSRGVNCFFIHNDIVKKKNIVIDPIEKVYRKGYGPGPNGGHRQDMQYRKYISFNEAIQ